MKRILSIIAMLFLLFLSYMGWLLLGSATVFEEEVKYLYIRTGENQQNKVMQTLQNEHLLRRTGLFSLLASQTGVWERLKPGKYAIHRGMSLLQLIRNLRNGRQEPVQLVITKLRTRENLAALLARKTEHDSVTYIQLLNNLSFTAEYGLDTNSIMSLVFPNTYEILWTSAPEMIFGKLQQQHKKFWTEERLKKAQALQLSPSQVYTLASIVEEETNRQEEKSTIASVYLNRLRKNMYLGADPTVKFALRNFALKRILFGHISSSASSPYNTYRNKGLPPGPICTPTAATIDAVLNPAATNYLFFCAQPGGTGLHNFAATEAEHFRNAKAYQQWLDSIKLR